MPKPKTIKAPKNIGAFDIYKLKGKNREYAEKYLVNHGYALGDLKVDYHYKTNEFMCTWRYYIHHGVYQGFICYDKNNKVVRANDFKSDKSFNRVWEMESKSYVWY